MNCPLTRLRFIFTTDKSELVERLSERSGIPTESLEYARVSIWECKFD